MKRIVMNVKSLLIGTLLSAGLVACNSGVAVRPTQISGTRQASPKIKTLEMAISKKELQTALNRSAPVNDIRMVVVFSGGSGTKENEEPPPEYRFFDIKPESAYSLLGLRNNDILVAAHDFIVYNPPNFPAYVSHLLQLPEGFIEIRRAGEPYLLKYSMRE